MAIPQYQRIRAILEAQIVNGDLEPGDMLPTEAELQVEYKVSRSVAQRVLNDLAHAGLVVRRKRLGTRVAEGARQINVMRSVDPRLSDANLPGYMELVSANVVPAEAAAVKLPGIGDTEPVIQVIRVRRDPANGKATSVEVAAIPFSVTPNLLSTDLETVMMRAYLAEVGVAISRSRMYFDPVLLEPDIAELLELEPGIPVLRRRRLMWQANGEIAESTAYYLRPGAMEFYIEYSDQDSLHPVADDI